MRTIKCRVIPRHKGKACDRGLAKQFWAEAKATRGKDTVRA